MGQSISPFLNEIAPFLSLIGTLLVAIPFIWVSVRSRSFFMLRHQLWRRVHPKDAISDPAIREAVRNRTDLISFRALLMQADTVGEAIKIAQFANENGVDPGTLGECGRYFHRRDLRVVDRIPHLGRTKGASIGIQYVLGMLILLTGIFAVKPQALVSFKDDSTYFWIGRNDAELFHGSQGQVFSAADCPRTEGAANFTAVHILQLCNSFKSASSTETISKAVLAQRLGGIGFGLFFLAVFARWRRHFHAVRTAHQVRSWLAVRADA